MPRRFDRRKVKELVTVFMACLFIFSQNLRHYRSDSFVHFRELSEIALGLNMKCLFQVVQLKDMGYSVHRLPHIWLNIRALPHILGNPSSYIIKGAVSQDLLLQVFSWIMFLQAPEDNISVILNFSKFAEIFTSQGAPPISMTPVAKLPQVSTKQVSMAPALDLPPVRLVSLILVVNLPPV